MTDFVFPLEAYLRRIGYWQGVQYDIDSVRALAQAHSLVIPFENLDVYLGRSISLHSPDIVNKLIYCKRGGYCFEQNQLFFLALQHLGFSVRRLLGRVLLGDEPGGRTHQLSLLDWQSEKYLIDLGFGSQSPIEPLLLKEGFVQQVGSKQFCFRFSPQLGFVLQVKKEEVWKDLYAFDLSYVCQGDLLVANHYVSTHPDSFFVQNQIASLPVEGGRVSLLNSTLTRTLGQESEVMELSSAENHQSILVEAFGAELGSLIRV